MKKVVSELKRTLSLVLAFMMVATSVPQAAMNVLADEATVDFTVEVDENAEAAGFTKVSVSANDIVDVVADEDGTGVYKISANSVSGNAISLDVEYTNTDAYDVYAMTGGEYCVYDEDFDAFVVGAEYVKDGKISIVFKKKDEPAPDPEPENPLAVNYAESRIYVDGAKKLTVKAPKVTYNGAKAKAIFSIVENPDDKNIKIDAANGKITIEKANYKGKISGNTILKVKAVLEGNDEVNNEVDLVLSDASLESIAGEAVLVKISDNKIVKVASVSANATIDIDTTDKYAVKVVYKGVDKTVYEECDFVPSNAYTVKMPNKNIVAGNAECFNIIGQNKKVKFTVKANDKASKKWGKNGSQVITVATQFKAIDLDSLSLVVKSYDYAKKGDAAISTNTISANAVALALTADNEISISGNDVTKGSLKVTYKNANILKKLGANRVAFKAKKDTIEVTIKDNVSKKTRKIQIKSNDTTVTESAKATIKAEKKNLDASVSMNDTLVLTGVDTKATKVIVGGDPVKVNAAQKKGANKYYDVVKAISANEIVVDKKNNTATIAFAGVLPAGSYQLYATPVDANNKALSTPAKIKVTVKAVKADKINVKINGNKVSVSANKVSANGVATVKVTTKASISSNAAGTMKAVVDPVGQSNAVVKVKGVSTVNKFNQAFTVKFVPEEGGFVVTVKDLKLAQDPVNQVGYITVDTYTSKGKDGGAKYGLMGKKTQKIKITVKMPK